MAFDYPVESDLVDLSSWGSLLAHTPVIGGLLHLLRTGQSEEDDNGHAHNQSQGLVDDETILGFQHKCSLQEDSGPFTLGNSAGLPPALTASSVSVLLEDEGDGNQSREKLHSCSLGKRKKTLSWSDQHGGKNLCEYRWVASNSTCGNHSHNLHALGNPDFHQSEISFQVSRYFFGNQLSWKERRSRQKSTHSTTAMEERQRTGHKLFLR